MSTKTSTQAQNPDEKNLGRVEVIGLANALAHGGLITKHLSPSQFTKMLFVKRRIQKYLDKMSADETEAAKAHGLELIPGQQIPEGDKGFKGKLTEIHKRKFKMTNGDLNFIPVTEFKKWTDDCPVSISLVLAEYLMEINRDEV